MDYGKILPGTPGIASFGDGEMLVAAPGQAGICGPVTGGDLHTRRNDSFDKTAQRFCTAIRYGRLPDTPGMATTLALVGPGSRPALPHLNGAGDRNPVAPPPALAARTAPDPGFVIFDMVAGTAANSVPVRPTHSSAEFVKDLKGCFVYVGLNRTGKLHFTTPPLAQQRPGR